MCSRGGKVRPDSGGWCSFADQKQVNTTFAPIASAVFTVPHFICASGLLAGLYEFPTLPVTATDGPSLDAASSKLLSTYLASPFGSATQRRSSSTNNSVDCGSILHVFSHIRMTYHVRKTVLVESSERPELRQLSDDELLGVLPGVVVDGEVGQDDGNDDERPLKKKRKTVRVKSKSIRNADTEGAMPLPRVRWVLASEVEDEKCVRIRHLPRSLTSAISVVV